MAGIFEKWTTGLRVAWMGGAKAQRIFGAYGKVLGDDAALYMLRAVAETLPQYASDPASLALRGVEVGLEAGPSKSLATIANYLVHAGPLNALRGTPLGLLIALDYADFPGAVIVTQPGVAHSLSGSVNLDDIPLGFTAQPSWYSIAALDVAPVEPGFVFPQSPGHTSGWWKAPRSAWTFDLHDEQPHRFAVLFPGPTFPKSFTTWGTATFTGVENGSGLHPWPVATWNNPFSDTTYHVLCGPAVTNDPPLFVSPDFANRATAGVPIESSIEFTGTVDCVAWRTGSNPFCDPHPSDLARLRRVIASWRPAKVLCKWINVLVQGKMWGWPVRNWNPAVNWTPSTVVTFSP